MRKRKAAAAGLIALALVYVRLSVYQPETAQGGFYYEPSPIVNVVLPAWVTFTIDPFEVNKRGQVFSNEYVIENLGNTDVYIDFTDIRLNFANYWEFESLSNPVEDWMFTDRKAIYLALDFGRWDVPPAIVTDYGSESRFSIPLIAAQNDYYGDGSLLRLNFTGSVSAPAYMEWHPGDVRLSITYTIRPVEQEPTPQQNQEPIPPQNQEPIPPQNQEPTPEPIEGEQPPEPAAEDPPPQIESPPPEGESDVYDNTIP